MNEGMSLAVKTFYTLTAAETAGVASEPCRGRLALVSCRSGVYLARDVQSRYQELLLEAGDENTILHLEDIDFRFSDSETCVRLQQDVDGHDVFLFQALMDPRSDRTVDENYAALLIAIRALKEWGANRVTVIAPYLAYSRQDKPTKFQREPTTAKLMADLARTAGMNRLVTWHPHTPLRGFYGSLPVNPLEPLPLLLAEFSDLRGRDDVIVVAPDAGASKLVTHFAREMELRAAIASKFRPKPEEAVISEVIGDFGGKKTALVLDDMISTGGTVHALVTELVEKKGIESVYLAISHSLCTDQACGNLMDLHEHYGLRRITVTDSIPQTDPFLELGFVSVRSLADILARVVNRIHHNRPVSELFLRGSEESS